MNGLNSKVSRPIASALAVAITLVAVAIALRVPQTFGWALYPQQLVAMILALVLPLAYLSRRAFSSQSGKVVPWYDVFFAALSLASVGYIAIYYQGIVNAVFLSPLQAYLPGGLAIILLLEVVRRVAGWPLASLIGICLVYAVLGEFLPGRIQAPDHDWRIVASYMAIDSNGILGTPLMIAATVVIAFILFGHVLNRSGGSTFLMDAAFHLVGRFRGGAMKISILASGLFGSISGSAVANVMATGVVTIPIMRRARCSPHKAAAIEAAASTGGQLMPPVMGASAFLMAEYLGVSYFDVILAALVPALLYYIALFIQVDLDAAKTGQGSMTSSDQQTGRKVFGGMHFLLAFAVLFHALFVLSWSPERAALASTLSVASTALLFGYSSARPTFLQLLGALISTGHAVVEIVLISAAAGIVIGVLNLTGLGFTMSVLLVEIGANNLALLLVLCAGLSILLGMGLPTLGVYVLLAALVAPALVKAGIEPMAAHLFVLYFGMLSMITPPVALAVLAAKSIADSSTYRTAAVAMKLGWVAYIIPFLFVLSPSLLLSGEIGPMILTIGGVAMGVWLISIAIAGYFLTITRPPERLCFVLMGSFTLIPADVMTGSIFINVVGILGGLTLLSHHIYRHRLRQQ